MSGSRFLKRSAFIYQNSPFISSSSNDGRGEIISYQDAYHIASCYKSWIQSLLVTEISRSHTHPHSDNNSVEIVIAILSHNSPELFLTMMGSMDLPNHAVLTAVSNKCIDQDLKNNTRHKKIYIKTAMLNVRWSPKEIATAMRVHGSNINGGKLDMEHVTIILCSKDMEQTAQQACGILNDTEQKERGVKHTSCSVIIPEINQLPSVDQDKRKNGEMRLQSPEENSRVKSIYNDAILLFTSGTTSGPKGVRLSILSLLTQAMAKLSSPCSYNRDTRMLASTVPFFHVGGLSSALAIVMTGGMLCFPRQFNMSAGKVKQGFDPHVILQNMNSRSANNINDNKVPVDVNTLVIVPAMLHAILMAIENENHGAAISASSSSIPHSITATETATSDRVYSGVRLLLVGGQSITQPQLEKSKIYFPNARVVQTFACTEAGSSITFATIHDPKVNNRGPPVDHSGTGKRNVNMSPPRLPFGTVAGFPPHHIDIQIYQLDDDNNATTEEASSYQVGAIGTRGPHVMNGYWKRGALEAEDYGLMNGDGLKRNGWFVLNDLGYVSDDGQLYFCGRSNDIIRTGGESVFAPEVETILLRHSQIDQCAVFALPDEKFGERVCAALVMKPSFGSGVGNPGDIVVSKKMRNEMRSFCAEQNLTGYKRPRTVFLCSEFPRNSSGKVLKRELSSSCARLEATIQSKL